MDAAPIHDQTDPPLLGDHEGYPVYPMPAFATVEAADPAATVRFFTEALDFDVMFRGPEVDGVHTLTHLRRAKYQDVLVVPARRAVTPGGSVTFTIQAGEADRVDALAVRASQVSGLRIDGPVDTPWNTREFALWDPDGNRFVVTGRGRAPLEDFAEVMGPP